MEVIDSSDATMQVVRNNARGVKGWLKFLGILNIISGALSALSIVGIIFAWVPIWLGILMFQAGARAGDYAERGDPGSLAGFTGKIRTLYVITGIVTLVSIGLTLIMVLVGAIVGVTSTAVLTELLQEYIN